MMKINLLFITSLLLYTQNLGAFMGSEFRSNDRLLEIIRDISIRYNVHFTYDREIVEDVEVAHYTPEAYDSVDEALSQVLAGTKLKYVMLEMKYVIIYQDDAEGMKSLEQMVGVLEKLVNQNKEKRFVPPLSFLESSASFRNVHLQKHRMVLDVSGIVTDQAGEPLIGVNVMVQGTTRGTATDFDGRFTLEDINEKATLIFSYVGYQSQEIALNGRSNISIIMIEDSQTLEEVVVVGYGTQRKINLVGAVSDINIENMEMRPGGDITRSLQGTIPGLNIKTSEGGDPSKSLSVNIRGFNSINGGSPLILVDGIEESLANINPNDIESISVLKDAEAAAIYGARGAFGVLLVTTKKGRSGKYEIKYSNNFSWTTPTTRTDFISDPYVYGKMVDQAIKSYNGGNYTGYNDDDWDIIQRVANGEIEPYHEKQSNGSYKFYYNTDFYDVLFRKWSPSQLHNISVSGGSDNLSAYFSGRINKGLKIQKLQDAEINRYNLNFNLNFKPYEWLEISGGSRLSSIFDEVYGGTANGWGDPLSASMFRDMYPWYPIEIDGIGVDVGRTGTGGPARVAAQLDGNNWRRWNYENITNTIRGKISPINQLEFNFEYSYRIDREDNTFRYTPFEYLSSKSLSTQTGGLNRHGEWRYKDEYKALNIYGSYAKNLFEDNHHFKLMLGFNQEELHRNRVIAQMEELLSRTESNLGLGTEMYNVDGNTLDWSLMGYFGRFNYDYKERYLIEVNTRYDGSSRFPSDSRWGLFPSVAGAWRLDNEPFWGKFNPIIQTLKIRMSYGKLGNQTVDPNTFRQILGLGKTEWLDKTGSPLYYARIPAPLPETIGWEKVNSVNLGLDFAVFNNRLFGTVDIYERNTSDMYLPGEPLPAVFGASEPRRSYASLKNRGYEVSLNYRSEFDLLGSEFSYELGANLSNFRGIITKIDNPSNLLSAFREGQELGEIWGYHILGQFQSDEEAAKFQERYDFAKDLATVYRSVSVTSNKEWNHLRAGDIIYADLNEDGQINDGSNTLADPGDQLVIGNAMPRFPFGFNLSAEWKGISFSIIGQGIGHQDWYPMGPLYWGVFSRPYISFQRKDLLENMWSSETPENKFPQVNRPYYAYNKGREAFNFNDYYLENLGYLRIKNLTFGYEIPQKFISPIFIKRMNIFASGENILTWSFGGLTKYLDPEVVGSDISYSNPNSASPRSDPDLVYYPMGRTYLFGIQINF